MACLHWNTGSRVSKSFPEDSSAPAAWAQGPARPPYFPTAGAMTDFVRARYERLSSGFLRLGNWFLLLGRLIAATGQCRRAILGTEQAPHLRPECLPRRALLPRQLFECP